MPKDDWPEFIPDWQDQHDRLLLDPPEPQEVLAEDWRAVLGKGEKIPPLQRKSPKELRKFVEGVIANRYFLSAQIPASQAGNTHLVFLPLALGGLENWEREQVANIGLVYSEYGKDQAPRSINGLPMFFSCKLLHKDDWALADAAIRKALKAQGEALDELENRETETGEARVGRTEDTAPSSQAREGAAGQEEPG